MRPEGNPLISHRDAIREMAETLRRETIIAIDTEFIRETTFYPKVALIQVATRDETWLVDPVEATPEDLQPLLDVLKDPGILKVMHAAHSDQECFHTAYGMTLTPVIDTAVCAALIGMGDNLGLGRLLKDLMNLNLPKGRARARWLARPLSDELLDYAEQDVAHLVRLGEILIEKLKAKDRFDWALEESVVDAAQFDPTPLDMAKRVAKSGQVDWNYFPVLVELFAWREDRARHADLPRGWVADNETLVALSKVRPKSIDELRSFRGLKPKEVDRSGNHILDAVKRGLATPRDSYPKVSRTPVPHGEKEELIVDLLQSYVSFLASQHEIANRFLLSSNKAFSAVMHADKPIEAWIADGILSPQAAKLIGEDLKALLSGKRALAVRKGRVEILSLD
jgi:ribonuclease D